MDFSKSQHESIFAPAHRISGNTRLIPWRISDPFSVNCAVLTALKMQSIFLKLLCHPS